jgi:hypothetical protein
MTAEDSQGFVTRDRYPPHERSEAKSKYLQLHFASKILKPKRMQSPIGR